MIIHVLFMQRKERYEGEFGPEVVAAIDEFMLNENPEHWRKVRKEAVEAHITESAGFAEVLIKIDGAEIRKRCLGDDRTLMGEIQS